MAASPGLDLKPSSDSSVRGLSLPQKKPATEKDTPDWLSQLRSTIPEEESEPSPEAPSQPELGDEGPQWLNEIVESSKPSKSDMQSTERAGLTPTPTEDLPDWLQNALEKPSIEPTIPETDLETLMGAKGTPLTDKAAFEELSALEPLAPGELPDWLQGATVPEQPAPPAVDLEPTSPGEDSADWLQEPTLAEPAASAAEPEIEPGEIPDWLEGPSTKGPSAPAAEPEIEPGEIPDWLRADALPEPEIAAPPEPEGPSIAEVDGSLPDWLQDLAEETTTPEPSLPTEKADVKAEQIPDWLQTDTPTPATAKLELSPAIELSEIEAGEAPDWLQDVRVSKVEIKEPAPAAESDLQPSDFPGFEAGDVPDWLQDMKAGPIEIKEPAPAAEPDLPSGEPSEIKTGDVPDWLQDMKAGPIEIKEPAPAAEPDLQPSDFPGFEAGDAPDWLQDMKAGPIEIKEPAPAVEPDLPSGEPSEIKTDDVPDSLQDTRVGEVEIKEPAPAAEPDLQPSELPDWLQSDGPSPVEPAPIEPETPQPPAVEEDDAAASQAPDWLDTLAVPAADEDEIDQAGGELPDWLREFTTPGLSEDDSLAQPTPLLLDDESDQPRPSSQTRPATSPLVAENLRDWLGETVAAGEEETEDPSQAPTRQLGGAVPLVPAELPDWLAAAGDSSEQGGLPDWLVKGEDAPPAPHDPAATLAAAEKESLPSWLAEEDDIGIAAQPAEPTDLAPATLPDWLQPPGEAQSEIQPAQLPDWLVPPDQLKAAPPPTKESPLSDLPAWPDDEPTAMEGLAQAIIPDWLQALKPKEDTPTLAEVEPETVETGGPLQGVRGAIAIEGAIVGSPVSQPLPKFVVTERQQAHIQVLQQIIHGGPVPKPKLASSRPAQWWLERALIPILILIAIAVPVFLDDPLVSFEAASITTEVNDTFWLVESLPENSAVVVAFDYTPAQAGELESVAAPLIHHLMNHRMQILAVSTALGGPQLAQNLMEQIAQDYDYQYGTDFLNLGYIPGEAMGLKSFAANPWGMFQGPDFDGQVEQAQTATAAASMPNSLSDVKLVLILTAQRNDLVAWIEQVGQLPEMENVPLAAGVSAGLGPWARPYFQNETAQLKGLVSGIADAAQYESQPGLTDQANVAHLHNSQTLGLIVIVLFIILGLLWGSLAGLSKGRRSDG